MKTYKAIFFDWDGTAVMSRKAPVDAAVKPMKKLLAKGVKLIIVSGTTLENIADGKLADFFGSEELENLYLGLGRGCYNYRFNEKKEPVLFADKLPEQETLLAIHDISYAIHRDLLSTHGFPTDIVFSRPNYCKIDLMVGQSRGDSLFLQGSELEYLKSSLAEHGFPNGLCDLITLSENIGEKHGMTVVPTCDAKYLEVGISSKSDNVNTILSHLQKECGICSAECSFFGDEYVGLEEGIFGSDSFMYTEQTKDGDFFDVSDISGKRPDNVTILGGGVRTFLDFLAEQGMQ